MNKASSDGLVNNQSNPFKGTILEDKAKTVNPYLQAGVAVDLEEKTRQIL